MQNFSLITEIRFDRKQNCPLSKMPRRLRGSGALVVSAGVKQFIAHDRVLRTGFELPPGARSACFRYQVVTALG